MISMSRGYHSSYPVQYPRSDSRSLWFGSGGRDSQHRTERYDTCLLTSGGQLVEELVLSICKAKIVRKENRGKTCDEPCWLSASLLCSMEAPTQIRPCRTGHNSRSWFSPRLPASATIPYPTESRWSSSWVLRTTLPLMLQRTRLYLVTPIWPAMVRLSF